MTRHGNSNPSNQGSLTTDANSPDRPRDSQRCHGMQWKLNLTSPVKEAVSLELLREMNTQLPPPTNCTHKSVYFLSGRFKLEIFFLCLGETGRSFPGKDNLMWSHFQYPLHSRHNDRKNTSSGTRSKPNTKWQADKARSFTSRGPPPGRRPCMKEAPSWPVGERLPKGMKEPCPRS